jgi:enamine deaminase RidA (YjgF/YER057c/UK114 family)
MPHTEFIQPAGLSTPGGYTHVVTSQGGKMVFVAGQVALDANAKLVGEGDLRAQTGQVFENLKIALAAAGAGFEDVVKVTIFVVNYKSADRAVIVEVRDRFVSKQHPPASTLVGVQSLARPEFMIEIEALAVVE